MMRRTVGVLAGAVLLAGAIQSPALAQQTQRPRLGTLDLTEEQQAQMEQLREKHQEEAVKSREEIVKTQAELMSLQAQTDLDLRELEQAMNHLSQLQNAEIIRGLENNREMMGLLTEEQLNSLQQGAWFLTGQFAGNRMFGTRGQAFAGRGRIPMRGQAFAGRGRIPMRGQAFGGRGRASMRGRSFGRGNAGWGGFGRSGIQRGRAVIPPYGRGVQPGNTIRQFRGRAIPPPPPPPPTE